MRARSLLLVTLLGVAEAAAQTTPPPAPAPAEPSTPAPAPAPSAPGEPHGRLAALAGTWDVAIRLWPEPGGTPLSATGTAVRRMILDGRVLEEELKSDLGGSGFTGRLLVGYDNQEQRYWSAWSDSLSTALLVSHGQCTPAGTVCTLFGEARDPATGILATTKDVLFVQSPDRQRVESWRYLATGEAVKLMELVYERRRE